LKTAVVFYSYEGNCRFAAKQIAANIKADLVQIQTVDEKKRRGFFKYLWGGSMTVRGIKPPLKSYDFNPDSYDLIILGTPVWAGSPAPAMKSFLSQTKINGKKIALFLCHAGGSGKAMKKFKAALEGNTIISELEIINPARNAEKSSEQIENWAKTLSI
jgi:flavodoxin